MGLPSGLGVRDSASRRQRFSQLACLLQIDWLLTGEFVTSISLKEDDSGYIFSGHYVADSR